MFSCNCCLFYAFVTGYKKNTLLVDPICLWSSVSDKIICHIFMISVWEFFTKSFHAKNFPSVDLCLLEHVNKSYLYCTIFIDQFRWNSLWDLHIILLKIHELHANLHREGRTLPVCILEITFGNNEYNECCGKVFVLLHRVHHLEVIYPIVFLANKRDTVMCEHNC